MATIDLDRDDLFDFNEEFFSVAVLEGYDKNMVAGIKEGWQRTRDFCREHLAPRVLEADRKNAEDPDHISWDILRLAGEHNMLSNFIPPFMGGNASGSPAILGPVMEEQAAVDTAFSGMLGGHGLCLVGMMITMNMRLVQQVAEKTVAHEKDDKPYVIDCAITEPTAGTDVEEVDLYPRAKLVCQAKRQNNGAILNGRKCFISTGHMATDHTVMMPYDLRDPVNNYGYFLVPNDAKGFSLGRKEIKMGHRASVISELIFEDCFVPEENIIMDTNQFDESRYRGQFAMLLEMVLGVTRTAVGAMGTGNARGSYERALAVAKTAKHKGRTMIHQQWVQEMLTNMYIRADGQHAGKHGQVHALVHERRVHEEAVQERALPKGLPLRLAQEKKPRPAPLHVGRRPVPHPVHVEHGQGGRLGHGHGERQQSSRVRGPGRGPPRPRN